MTTFNKQTVVGATNYDAEFQPLYDQLQGYVDAIDDLYAQMDALICQTVDTCGWTTVDGAARILKVSHQRISKMVADGVLFGFQIGRRTVVSLASVADRANKPLSQINRVD